MSIKTTIVHMPSGKRRLETRQGAWPINRNWNGFNTWPEYDHKPTKEEVDVFARELFKAMFGVEPIFIGMEDGEYEYDSRAGL